MNHLQCNYDLAKGFVKDFIKDLVKDLVKDFVKDFVNDFLTLSQSLRSAHGML